jgi:hypothetical protein
MSSRNPNSRISTPEEDLAQIVSEIDVFIRSQQWQAACHLLRTKIYNNPGRMSILKNSGRSQWLEQTKSYCQTQDCSN